MRKFESFQGQIMPTQSKSIHFCPKMSRGIPRLLLLVQKPGLQISDKVSLSKCYMTS